MDGPLRARHLLTFVVVVPVVQTLGQSRNGRGWTLLRPRKLHRRFFECFFRRSRLETSLDVKTDRAESLPDKWRSRLSGQLAAGEIVVGWLETDLDPRLQYAAELVVLTDRRMLASGGRDAAAGPQAAST